MLKFKPSNPVKLTGITVTYNNQEVEFATQHFDRSNITDPTRSMQPLNAYLNHLNDDDQKDIFETMQEIAEAFANVRSRERLTKRLKALVVKLYDTLDVDRMFNWFTMHLDINGSEVNEDYSPDDGPRDLTYIRSEYKGLVRLGVVIKPMLPIIGEYMAAIAKDVGTAYKEYRSMDLLDPRIKAREEWDRLVAYVEANSNYSKKTTSAVYGSLGTDELPEWLMSFAVIRKVLLLDPQDANEHIVRKMYNYLKSKMDQLDKSFERIGDKRTPADSSREEDNVSLLENTKVRQEISKRVPKGIAHYITSQTEQMALTLDPNIDISLMWDCIEHAKNSSNVVTEVQYMICGPLVSPVFSARSLYLISHIPMSYVLGICQAILHRQGLDILASICTAKFEMRDPNEFTMAGEGQVRSRVCKQDVEELNRIYPHYKRSSAKQLTPKNNVGNDWIDELLSKVSSVSITYSESSRLPNSQHNGTALIIPSNFRPVCAGFLKNLDTYYRSV